MTTAAPAANRKEQSMPAALSSTLLTTDTSLVMLLDYQKHVIDGIHSTDHELIELNGRALARASTAFKVPVILSTIGVKLRGDKPTVSSLRADLAEEPEYDRNTMNAWEDKAVRDAVTRSGRRRLIFAGLWTEVCLLYPVLHAQRDGFETYFVSDAVGGSTAMAHDTAIQRMIQAGSQPITVNALLTEWIRDWGTFPYAKEFATHMEWYAPEIERVRKRLRAKPYEVEVA
ncbi:MAG: isochorismatase family protein [Cytophagaceae bacterium]|nr:isochorismatase family protein [Gemmatimonadaceae bacterium]